LSLAWRCGLPSDFARDTPPPSLAIFRRYRASHELWYALGFICFASTLNLRFSLMSDKKCLMLSASHFEDADAPVD